jgi:hypothetical protein
MYKASLLIMTVTPMSLVIVRAHAFARNHGAGGSNSSGGILTADDGKTPEGRVL